MITTKLSGIAACQVDVECFQVEPASGYVKGWRNAFCLMV
jgi:hypothetical protein